MRCSWLYQPKNRSQCTGPPRSTRTVSGSRVGTYGLEISGTTAVVAGASVTGEYRCRPAAALFGLSSSTSRGRRRVSWSALMCWAAGHQPLGQDLLTLVARPPSTRPRSGRRCEDHIQVVTAHFAGPRSLVISHDHEFGIPLMSNQLWLHRSRVGIRRRRSPVWPRSRSSRYIVDSRHR